MAHGRDAGDCTHVHATPTHAVRSISPRAGARGDVEGAGHFLCISFLFVSSSTILLSSTVYYGVSSQLDVRL